MDGSHLLVLSIVALIFSRAAQSFGGLYPTRTKTNQRLPSAFVRPIRIETRGSVIMSADLTQGNRVASGNEFVVESANKKSKTDDIRNSSNEVPFSSTVAGVNQTKGTMYITVGPQCSGKTTVLKLIFGEAFHKNEEPSSSNTPLHSGGMDITIDDQSLVYIPVPVRYFLHDWTGNGTAADGIEGNDMSLTKVIFKKTIQERIVDSSNDELRRVIRRLGGQISSEEFASLLGGRSQSSHENIGQLPSETERKTLVSDDLVAAVEDMISSNDNCLPEQVDLFIVESIFQPRPLDLLRNNTLDTSPSCSAECSALDAALDLLKAHANDSQLHLTTAPLAWGNTNTRPREYTSALETALHSGRPVEFIVYGGFEACDMIREHQTRREYRMNHDVDSASGIDAERLSVQNQSHVLFLPKLTRLELFKRNLHRFSKTGRYIPSAAINDAMIRVDSLLASAAAEAKKTLDPSSKLTIEDAKFRLDYELAKLADFELNRDRTVAMLSTQNVNGNAGSRTNGVNRHVDRDNGDRFGRGRSGRGRNFNVAFQGRSNNQGRWNGGRQSTLQHNNYEERRQYGHYHQGWNNYEPGDRSAYHQNNRFPNEHRGYNNTHYNNRDCDQRAGRSANSLGQSQNNRYHTQQGRGNQYNNSSANQFGNSDSRNAFNSSYYNGYQYYDQNNSNRYS